MRPQERSFRRALKRHQIALAKARASYLALIEAEKALYDAGINISGAYKAAGIEYQRIRDLAVKLPEAQR